MTRRVAVTLVRRSDLQGWADRVNVHLGKAAASVVAAGRELIAAKAALEHGEWERMFAGHEQAVKDPVPFRIGTAQRLIAVAKHPILSKAAHGPCLPPSWRTLYELTKVPEPMLRKALSDGRVHPEMERREIRALRSPVAAKTNKEAPSKIRTDFDDCCFDVDARLRKTFFALKPEERPHLLDAIRQLLTSLERESQEEQRG